MRWEIVRPNSTRLLDGLKNSLNFLRPRREKENHMKLLVISAAIYRTHLVQRATHRTSSIISVFQTSTDSSTWYWYHQLVNKWYQLKATFHLWLILEKPLSVEVGIINLITSDNLKLYYIPVLLSIIAQSIFNTSRWRFSIE